MADLWKATPYLTGEELLTHLIRGRRLCYSIHNAETTGDLWKKNTKLDPILYHTYEMNTIKITELIVKKMY